MKRDDADLPPASRICGAYEAKTRLPELLDLVERGDQVVITRHQRPVARLIPYESTGVAPDLIDRLLAFREKHRLPAGVTTKHLIDEGRRL